MTFRANLELNDGVDLDVKVSSDKDIMISLDKHEPVHLSVSSVNLVIATLMTAVDTIEEDE